ncbi:VOC family protein [Breznakia pachnodae]|uniref:Catechol 2,3-dioxygenase-like lactoylglutathione lyase family enzyme n=1 Tax=Breznakia pachnodae TaxID=265178 RepID=A0ABU0E5Q6_9FIRM|nr:VOC family protein [Breznakia pachnodae]MDQ0362059.1 catechol 2,3-dioxygenase-like lactoylglutathione lyase family enzyme [Breznakia pachnodae]
MEFKSIMHVSFFTKDLNAIRDFYENKLGLKAKMVIPFGLYKGTGRGPFAEMAETKDENDTAFIYIEIAPGQFLEFFPAMENQIEHSKWNERMDYSHFALLVDDIYKTRKAMEAKGIEFDTEISKGPTGTYQMWLQDPDGNKFEIMQYTKESLQVLGYREEF